MVKHPAINPSATLSLPDMLLSVILFTYRDMQKHDPEHDATYESLI